MKKLPLVFLLVSLVSIARADELVWSLPWGTIGLPFSATETLLGYDAVLKQSIGGFSLPFYTDPKQIVTLEIGAVGAWPNNGATIEPYFALGHDILREIPGLNQYQSLHANVFGRYASEKGAAGVGISLSYSFAGSPSAPVAAQASTPQPTSVLRAGPEVPTQAPPESGIAPSMPQPGDDPTASPDASGPNPAPTGAPSPTLPQ